jgi:hypothetical protein
MLAVTSCHDYTRTSAELLMVGQIITQNLHPEFLQKSIVRDGKKGKMPSWLAIFAHHAKKTAALQLGTKSW